jgi:hypothetical protein
VRWETRLLGRVTAAPTRPPTGMTRLSAALVSAALASSLLLGLTWVPVLVPTSASAQLDGEPVNAFVVTVSLANQIDVDVFTVPVGKRLIIDYLSLSAEVPAGQRVTGFLINLPVVHFFVVFPQGRNISGRDVFTTAQALRVVIEPGKTVRVRAERNASGTNALLWVALAGTLVNV